MNRKIPTDAFAFYQGLGPGRSYESVASKFGVTKRAVTKLAQREKWAERLAELEKKARERTDEKVVESMEEMNSRHLKMMRVLQQKALEALRSMGLDNAMDAARALDLAVRQERLIRGEPTDRSAVNVEDIIKREYAALMVEGDDDDRDDEAAA